MPAIEEWHNWPLSPVYPIVFIDGIVFNVRREKSVQKTTTYVVLGVNADGMKEILSIEFSETESAKYWLSVLNSLKHRGVQDILVLCSDGLSGIKEAIEAAFPQDRTPAMYSPYGSQHAETRVIQGYEGICSRLEGNLSRS